jgi:hypothetical protein
MGVILVGEALSPGPEMVETNEYSNVVVTLLVYPALKDLALPTLELEAEDEGRGELAGAVTLQILTVPSADPEARKIRSSDDPRIAEAEGRTQTAHTASVCPTSVSTGSTFPASQIFIVKSCPPEKTQPPPPPPPPPSFVFPGYAARDVTIPACPRCVK